MSRGADSAGADLLIDQETLRVYYTCQYDRAGRHETNRLNLSSYVLGGSIVAVGWLAGRETGDELTRAVMAASLAIVNVLAIIFALRSAWWVRVHLARVNMSLRHLSPALAEFQLECDRSQGMREPERRYAKDSNLATDPLPAPIGARGTGYGSGGET